MPRNKKKRNSNKTPYRLQLLQDGLKNLQSANENLTSRNNVLHADNIALTANINALCAEVLSLKCANFHAENEISRLKFTNDFKWYQRGHGKRSRNTREIVKSATVELQEQNYYLQQSVCKLQHELIGMQQWRSASYTQQNNESHVIEKSHLENYSKESNLINHL